jgi:hypothetical protein
VAGGVPLTGRHVQLDVAAGSAVNLYADLNHTLLIYLRVPLLQLCSSNWSVVSWGRSHPGPSFDPLARFPATRTSNLALPSSLHMVPDRRTRAQQRSRSSRFARRFGGSLCCSGRRQTAMAVHTAVHTAVPAGAPVPDAAAVERLTAEPMPQVDNVSSPSRQPTRRLTGRTVLCEGVLTGRFADARQLADHGGPDTLTSIRSNSPGGSPAVSSNGGAVLRRSKSTPSAGSTWSSPSRRSVAAAGERELRLQELRLLRTTFDLWRCVKAHEGTFRAFPAISFTLNNAVKTAARQVTLLCKLCASQGAVNDTLPN